MFTPVSWHLLRYNDFLFLLDLSWARSERNFPFAPVNGKSKHSAKGIYPLCITQKLSNSVHLAGGVLISSCPIFFLNLIFILFLGMFDEDLFCRHWVSGGYQSGDYCACLQFFKSIILPHEWYIKRSWRGCWKLMSDEVWWVECVGKEKVRVALKSCDWLLFQAKRDFRWKVTVCHQLKTHYLVGSTALMNVQILVVLRRHAEPFWVKAGQARPGQWLCPSQW